MISFLTSRRTRTSPLSWLFFFLITYLLYRGYSSTFSSRGPNGERYAPKYLNKLPQTYYELPKVQADFPTESQRDADERELRQEAVRDRFEQTWLSYKNLAYGADELQPITGKPLTAFGGWGATLVDSLDALWILGLKDEFEDAVLRASVIDFSSTNVEEINVFETTIRYLGGFLGAYDVSGGQYPILLDKAVEIGELIYLAFDTPNRMPITRWKQHPKAFQQQRASNWALLAEIASLSLELTRLSQLTGNTKYYDAAYRVAKAMDERQQTTLLPGLWPIIVNAEKISFTFNGFTFGGMADSAFEYLPKMHALTGGSEPLYSRDYERAINAAHEYLFYRPMTPDNADILVSGSTSVNFGSARLEPQGQHLSCFTGGMLLLGSKLLARPADFDTGRKLTDGCVWAYDSLPSGIMPEVFHMVPCPHPNRHAREHCNWSEETWHAAILERQAKTGETLLMDEAQRLEHILSTQNLPPGYTQIDDARYILRPEAIESVFILYRATGDKKYADAAWRMWQAIDAATRTDLAHAGLTDVTVEGAEVLRSGQTDKMESFWLAETLKYFYLIFSDPELMSLDRYVLNTEAHPFLRPGAEWREGIDQDGTM